MRTAYYDTVSRFFVYMDLYFNKIKMDVEQVIYIIGWTVGIGIWIGLVLYCISENRKDRK